MRNLEAKRARDLDLDDDRDDRRGTPGRSTLTSRLPPAASSIARAVVRQLQAKGDLAGPDAHEVAAYGMGGAGGALPFLDQIQRAFGHHDISGVRAHIGGRASEASSALGASAYASGDSVAFGSSPDLHLAAHEAAHVVQQRGGVRLSGGLGQSGDEYEVNADAVADRVVRGESAQDLLDPFSHRGAAGGAAVQRRRHGHSSPGVQDFDRMLLGSRPTPAQIVACMRRHPDDARAIMARVTERLGEPMALQVHVAVNLTAPELVPVLGSPDAHGTSPVGTAPPPRGDAITGGPHAPPREATPSPVDLHGHGDSVTATAHPDDHSTVEATVGPGELSPELREVRVVIHDATPGDRASGELEVGDDLEAGRAHASASGELRPDGEGGPTLGAEATVSAGPGDDGRLDVRGSGSLELRVPVGDHAALREALVITEDGHLRVEAGADLVRRVRGLPDGNAAREPLLHLFMSVDTDMRSGERSVSGGLSLEGTF